MIPKALQCYCMYCIVLQRASVLGNKIEMQLTEIIEQNPTVLRVGIHFEFNDARNRVSKHLQKNLDTCEYDAVSGIVG